MEDGDKVLRWLMYCIHGEWPIDALDVPVRYLRWDVYSRWREMHARWL